MEPRVGQSTGTSASFSYPGSGSSLEYETTRSTEVMQFSTSANHDNVAYTLSEMTKA